MRLELQNISKLVKGEPHISDVSLSLDAGTINILLGPTLAGKTTLLRLMAGLERPTSGRLLVDGHDVTGVPVQKRNVAMVYQQFINYPNLSVFENIASPLRIAGLPKPEIESKVRKVADLLQLVDTLKRKPQELSGGQQQRIALARALVKEAELVLLDEPLANLDYKLREELRKELPKIFSQTGAIFVYATTEPSEALLLGGNTATLHEGRVSQFGPTIDVFRRPDNLTTARVFSDPPLNTLPVAKKNNALLFKEQVKIPINGRLAEIADGDYTVGVRPYHLYLKAADGTAAVAGEVTVTEITGSNSYVHVDIGGMRWVAFAKGIHEYEIGTSIQVHVDPTLFYIFDMNGELVHAPALPEGR